MDVFPISAHPFLWKISGGIYEESESDARILAAFLLWKQVFSLSLVLSKVTLAWWVLTYGVCGFLVRMRTLGTLLRLPLYGSGPQSHRLADLLLHVWISLDLLNVF